jgi:hypothetical protein
MVVSWFILWAEVEIRAHQVRLNLLPAFHISHLTTYLKSDDTGGEEAETIEGEVDRLKRELSEKNAQSLLLFKRVMVRQSKRRLETVNNDI